jgi:hypothetical protein
VSIRKARAARAVLALIVGCVVTVSLPAVAGAATCPDVEPTSQPFVDQGDDLHYFLAPGGDFERYSTPWRASGYTYTSKYLNPTEYAGHRVLVLEGASITSPAFCVDNSRPLLRLGARVLSDYGLSDARLTIEAVMPDDSAVGLGEIRADAFWSFGWTPQIPLAPLLGLADGDSAAVQLRLSAYGRWAVDAVSIDPYRH